MIRILTIAILLFVFNLRFTQAQEKIDHIFKHYTVDDGLPSSEVYFAHQDREGFMWFCTDRGVVRYDGKTFANYTTIDGLCDNTLFNIYETNDGELWFYGYNGCLSVYSDGEFRTYSIPAKAKKSFPVPVPHHIQVSPDKKILYGFRIAFVVTDIEGNVLREQKFEEGKDIFYVDSSSVHTIIHTNILKPLEIMMNVEYEFHYGDKVLEGIPKIWPNFSLDNRVAGLFKQHSSGKNYFTYKNFVATFEGEQLVDTVEVPATIVAMNEDKEQNLWVSLNTTGVLRFKDGDLTIPPDTLLKDELVTSVFQDHEKGYWFTTAENGIYYLSNYGNSHIKLNEANSHYWDKEELNVSSDLRKLLKLKRVNEKLVLVDTLQIPENAFPIPLNDKVPFLKDEMILHKISDSVLSVGVGIAEHYHYQDYFFTGKYDRLIRVNRLTAEVKENLLGHRVYSVVPIDSHHLYIGTINGLFEFEIQLQDQIRDEQFKPISDHPLLKKRINSIELTSSNEKAFGLHGYGMLFYKNGTYINLTTKEGLLSNSIVKVRSYEPGVFWIASSAGINKVEWNGSLYEVTRSITVKDGLLTNEINDFTIRDGVLYAISSKGVSMINSLEESTNEVPVFLESIAINFGDTNHQSHYDLDYFENNISISLQGISFNSSDDIHYKYKLIGVDEDWHIGFENLFKYQLSPGDYTFKAYAGIDRKRWSEKPIVVSFSIANPFWQTIWFWLLVHVFIFLVGYLLNKERLKRLRNRKALEDDLDEARQQALSSQMNPHFLFNTMNSLQSFVMKGEKREATIMIAKFSSLMRKILANSREKLIPLEESLESLELYITLEKIRCSNRFDCNIDIGSDIDTSKVLIAPLLIQPFVENAIWHGVMVKNDGERGIISIRVSRSKDELRVEVEDNGVGRDFHQNRKKAHNSLGANITNKRIELMNRLYKGKVEFSIIDLKENNLPLGTKVVFTIPFIVH